MYISISPTNVHSQYHPSLLCAYVVHVHQIVLHHCNINLLTALVIQLNPQHIYQIQYTITFIFFPFIIVQLPHFLSYYHPPFPLHPRFHLLPLISSVIFLPFFKLATPHLSLRPTPPTHAAPISPTNRGFKY